MFLKTLFLINTILNQLFMVNQGSIPKKSMKSSPTFFNFDHENFVDFLKVFSASIYS